MRFFKKACAAVLRYIKDHWPVVVQWAKAGWTTFKNGMNGIWNKLPKAIKVLVITFWPDFVKWAYNQLR